MGVYENNFFQVRRQTLLEFESRLSLEEEARTPYLALSSIIERVNKLLLSLGHPGLGFTRSNWPDEKWLYRITRYVDPANVLGIFKRKVHGAPLPNAPVSQVYAILI